MDYGKFLIISLGSGAMKKYKKYHADKAAKWGILGWLGHNNGGIPMFDSFTHASARLVDFHISVLLRALGSKSNYLRIQVCHFPSTCHRDCFYCLIVGLILWVLLFYLFPLEFILNRKVNTSLLDIQLKLFGTTLSFWILGSFFKSYKYTLKSNCFIFT